MVAVALYATDPASRRLLERLAGEQAGVTIVGTADSPGALARLLDRTQVEAVLADARPFLTALLAADRPDAATAENGEAEPSLTPREIEVLAAMADGASNKVIARRLGISFHTAKFHVASILAKLDADSRTEAVAHAARLGLVML
ncbi:MAG TPA: LuxR C-terminal-related transcriptional regulator [Stellaceae bacterium]